jgi:type III secretory pathway component EscU
MKKPILIISILLVIVLSLAIVRIYISNQVATSGVVLGQVQNEIDTYKIQNIQLSEKLYSQSSLTNIAKEAAIEGYVTQSTDFVLNGQIPVAYTQ